MIKIDISVFAFELFIYRHIFVLLCISGIILFYVNSYILLWLGIMFT